MTPHRRALWPFAALSASYFAHIGFFNPYLPLWLKDQGQPLWAISLLISVQSATRLVAPYGWGWVSDHTGERVKLLRLGATLALIVSLALWWPLGLPWLALALGLMFFNTSAMMPMSEAAMALLVSDDDGLDVRRYGRVRLWGSLGFLVTVLTAGAWFEHFGIGHFPGWTALTLLALVCSVWLLPDLKESLPHGMARIAIRPVLRQRPVQWFFAALFFHVLSHMAVYLFFSLYLDAAGYSKTFIGLMWAVSVVMEIAWFFTQGRWLPRWSPQSWLVGVALVMVLRMGLTVLAPDQWGWLVLAQALHALTFAAHHAVCIAWLSRHFPGPLRGRGQALYAVLGYGLPGVLGGLLGGALSTQWGLGSVFGMALLSAVLATLCATQLGRNPPAVRADRST